MEVFRAPLEESKAEEMADCREEIYKEVLGGYLPYGSP